MDSCFPLICFVVFPVAKSKIFYFVGLVILLFSAFTFNPSLFSMNLVIECITLVAAALLLVALIVSPMLINTQLAMISYQIHEDQVQLAQIKEDNQRVQSQVNLKSSPEKVRKAALDAGYVPAGETGYVTLKTSKIEGGTPPVPVAKE